MRWTALTAAVLVIATLITAGVVIADRLPGGGRQPESLVPATAFTFAKVDLNPAAAQKIAVWRLVHDVPKAHGRSNTDLFAEFVSAGLPRCTNYARDIRPWLGRRAGLAGVPSPAGGAPVLVAVLQVHDPELATTGLGRVVRCSGGRVGFVLSHGYAVITLNGSTAAALVDAAARSGSLGDDPGFRADQRALGGNQVAIGWVDGNRVADVARTVLAAGPSALLGGGVLPSLAREALRALARVPRGRLLIGLHAADHAFELTGTTVGAALGSFTGDATAAFRSAPGGSLAVFAIAGAPRSGADLALAARIRGVLGPVASLLPLLLGQRISVTARGQALVAALVPAFGRSGTLSADSLLGPALGPALDSGPSDRATVVAGFVRLGPLLALTSLGDGQALSSFVAAGLVVTRRGGEVAFRLRLVIGY